MKNLSQLSNSDKNLLNTAMIWYPVLTLGYGKRLGVWTQGCPRKCPDCISPEFQNFHGGRQCSAEDIVGVVPFGERPEGLTISGGEPFAQPEAILNLIKAYRACFQGDILVFTGYKLDELSALKNSVIHDVLRSIDVLVDGPYHSEYNNGKGLRGSTNQTIHVFRYSERYPDAENWQREMQCVLEDERMCFIGIPPL